MNLSYLFIRTSRMMKGALDKEFKSLGMTSAQFAVMNQIAQMDNATTSHRIAEAIGSDRPTVSGIINRLEQKGMICRREDPNDRRHHILSLTKEGRAVLLDLQKVADHIGNQIFDGFSEEEKAQLTRQLIKVNQNLEE